MVTLTAKAKKTILIIDDDVAMLNIFKLKMRKLQDWTVITAADSYLGFAMAGKQKFDFIFTAFKMQKLDGVELIQALRRSSFNQNTPLILMTSSIEQVKEEIQHYNYEEITIMAKPLEFDKVFAAVKNTKKQEKQQNILDSVFLGKVVDGFQNILVEMGNFKDIEKSETITQKKEFNYRYDYIGVFYVRTDRFNGFFTLGFPRQTFFNFASALIKSDSSASTQIDQKLDEMLDLFMNVFLVKTKKDIIESGAKLKEIHGIIISGTGQRISSQDAKIEFFTKYESQHGPFFIQVDIW